MNRAGKIVAVGIGPGAPHCRTPQAERAIQTADVVVGYRTYCRQIRDLTRGRKVISSGMRQEVERCNRAINEALKGSSVAVISSGDAGIYGMAGLILELMEARGIRNLPVEIVPGLTAASAAAALLGAPLACDFAVISLSDLLVPRNVILKKLWTLAASDLVCVLYNPRSAKRRKLFASAIKIFGDQRGKHTPSGFVKNATRSRQTIWCGPLKNLSVSAVDMSTVVMIGNRQTAILNGQMVTRRGYRMTAKKAGSFS